MTHSEVTSRSLSGGWDDVPHGRCARHGRSRSDEQRGCSVALRVNQNAEVRPPKPTGRVRPRRAHGGVLARVCIPVRVCDSRRVASTGADRLAVRGADRVLDAQRARCTEVRVAVRRHARDCEDRGRARVRDDDAGRAADRAAVRARRRRPAVRRAVHELLPVLLRADRRARDAADHRRDRRAQAPRAATSGCRPSASSTTIA